MKAISLFVEFEGNESEEAIIALKRYIRFLLDDNVDCELVTLETGFQGGNKDTSTIDMFD